MMIQSSRTSSKPTSMSLLLLAVLGIMPWAFAPAGNAQEGDSKGSLADVKAVGDPLLEEDKPPVPLSAKLTVEELGGTASVTEGAHLLKITVINNGKRALLLDGDNVAFTNAPVNEVSLTKEEVISPPAKNTLPGDVLEAGLSISTGGAVPVAIDAMNKAKNPGPAFYGRDEQRRDLAEARFGKRLVFPGESSSGQVFLSKAMLTSANISIPVFSHPDGTALGKINLPIAVTPVSSKPSVRTKEAEKLPIELEKPLEKKEQIERRH